jgi:hypothetical protein
MSAMLPPVISAVIGAVAGSSITYLLSRQQGKAEGNPALLFQFADLADPIRLAAMRSLRS